MNGASGYVGGLALVLSCLGGCAGQDDDTAKVAAHRDCAVTGDTPVTIPGGTFAMGQDDVYSEEGPVRLTTVDGFRIDPHEVTNRQFGEFVAATGYVTAAERPVDPALFEVPVEQIPADLLKPGSAVFTQPATPSRDYADWWKYVPGANWKKPYGPSGADAAAEEPVVHLMVEDMEAYARWRGGRLPTEAEWEYAAGASDPPSTAQPKEANSWQGVFPVVNERSDGFAGIAPVGCYAPNRFGLYDMVGNVWEVTADIYRAGHDAADRVNPTGPSEPPAVNAKSGGLTLRVMKGGSYLCAPNYCRRYRPAARQGRDPSLGASNVGFRLVYAEPPRG